MIIYIREEIMFFYFSVVRLVFCPVHFKRGNDTNLIKTKHKFKRVYLKQWGLGIGVRRFKYADPE